MYLKILYIKKLNQIEKKDIDEPNQKKKKNINPKTFNKKYILEKQIYVVV